jgi:hypothetical protein
MGAGSVMEEGKECEVQIFLHLAGARAKVYGGKHPSGYD